MLNYEKLINEKLYTTIATDFDGTVSEITNSPTKARINRSSKSLLSKLTSLYSVVAVISGRPVKQLRRLVDLENVKYIGNHGAEYLSENIYSLSHYAKTAEKLITDIGKELSFLIDEGFELEDKKFSLSIHYRNHPNPFLAEQNLLKIIEKYNNQILKIQRGKKVFDICPRNINKGDAIEHLSKNKNIRNFLYFGDDRTDIDAFRKMDELKLSGLNIYKIAVINNESPQGLLESCDYKISSIEEINKIFRKLIPSN